MCVCRLLISGGGSQVLFDILVLYAHSRLASIREIQNVVNANVISNPKMQEY